MPIGIICIEGVCMTLTVYSIFFILISFVAFISYIIIGVYIFMLNSKNSLNRVFAIFCIAQAIWSLSFLFFHAAPSEALCETWMRVGALGYCTYFGLGLHFSLILTNRKSFLKNKLSYVLIHGPGLVFLTRSLFYKLVAIDYIPVTGIWYQILPLKSLWYWGYIFFSVTYLWIGFINIFIWGKNSKLKRERNQSKTLLFFGVTPLILGMFTNIVFPALNIMILPALADVLMLSYILGIMYSIKRYNLMIITPEVAANEILSKVIDMVFLTDASGLVMKINYSVVNILGYQESEILGKPINSIIGNRSFNILNTKTNFENTQLFETSLIAKSGLKIPNNITVSNIYFEDVFLGQVYVAQDMRHIYRLKSEIEKKELLTQSLIKSNEKLKELDMLKSDFLSTISHELRTPINLIMSTLQLMNLNITKNAPESLDPKKSTRHLAIMRQNCYRLTKLINNLIDVTKIDAGYLNLNVSNNNIVSVIEEITLSIVEYVEGKDISLIFDTEMEEQIIAFDPEKIERIMLNLLSNAVKFTEAGGNIFVNIYNRGSSILISVKDTGIGIAKEKQTSIFQRFMQVDNSLTRNTEGSGIGLSLVKSLVEMHNGSIKVISEIGEGSEFIITLPVYTVDDTTHPNSINDSMQGNIESINIEFSDIYFN